MQIYRYDFEPHVAKHPKAAPSAPGQPGVNEFPGTSASNRSKDTTEASDSQLASLVQRFKSVPEIRRDVIEAAKSKVAGGEFGSRKAAEQLAATILRHEFF